MELVEKHSAVVRPKQLLIIKLFHITCSQKLPHHTLEKIMYRTIIVLICLLCLSLTVASADEITDKLKTGSDLYTQKKYSESISEINYALQLIRQKHAEELAKYFPQALPGWTAQEVESEAVAAIMGGMTMISKDYTKDSGESIQINMAIDSPLLASILMMFSNPMFAMGNKIETINGEKAVIDYDNDDKSGDINIVIASKILFTVEGDDVTLDEMKAYINAMDFGKLKAFIGG